VPTGFALIVDKKPLPCQDPRALSWLGGLVQAYRGRAARTPKSVMRYVHAAENLGPPTQIIHVWTQGYPTRDFHLLFFLHLPELPDGTVASWGPIRPDQLASVFAEFDAQPWMKTKVERKADRSGFRVMPNPLRENLVRDFIEPQLRSYHDLIRLHLFHPMPADFGLHISGDTGGVSHATYNGDLLAQNCTNLVELIFTQAAGNRESVLAYRRERRKNPVPTPGAPPAHTWAGHYAYLYPAVYIGKTPERPIAERIWGIYTQGPGLPVLEKTVKGFHVFAALNGAIGVADPDEARASRYLNLVAHVLRKRKTKPKFLRQRDISGFNWNRTLAADTAQPLQFTGWGQPTDDRRPRDGPWFMYGWMRDWLSVKAIETAFRQAANLMDDPDSGRNLDLLEAETHVEEGAYRQGFFLAWVVVETRIVEVWDHLLKSLATKPGPARKDNGSWHVNDMAAGLCRAGVIADNTTSKIASFNTKRNDILHGAGATEADARAVVALARQVLLEARTGEKAIRAKPKARAGRA
jgi:hypothetical protein